MLSRCESSGDFGCCGYVEEKNEDIFEHRNPF